MAQAEAAPVPVATSWVAVPMMLGAMLCLTLLDSLLKHLAATNPVGPLVFFRNLVQVSVLLMVARAAAPEALRTPQLGLHLSRGACLFATTVLITLALTHLPMAQTYALTFSAPLMATLLALVFLGERPKAAQWACMAAGFAGVLIALDPSAALSLALLLPLAQAAANAVFYVLTRYAGRREGALALVLWAGVGALTVSAVGLLAFQPMALRTWLLLGLAGLLGTCGQLLMAGAFRRASTAVVSPLVYSQIVWAMLLGFVLFDEVPSMSSIVGGLVVAASGIGVVRFSRLR